MTDKRRASRVQGAWSQKRSKKTSKLSEKDDFGSQPSGVSSSSIGSAFTFKPTVKKVTTISPERVINTDGNFDISNGPNGVSQLQFICSFIKPKEAAWMFEQLESEIPWKEQEITVWGKKLLQPRLTAWFGDFPYTYSKLTLKPFKWSPLLDILREKIQAATGFTFNSMLANLYRDNKDSVDWHSDDEKSLGDNPVIASLSFGDARMFELRPKPEKDASQASPASQKIKVPLCSGNLLIMKGATQHDWQHRIPKEYHDRSARINLTFRTIYQK